MKNTQAATKAKRIHANIGLLVFSLLFGFSALLAASISLAEEKIIKSHGYSFFGDLKYAADFTHLDYVNPDAPKGGEISIWGFGTLDSMHPYSRKGRAA